MLNENDYKQLKEQVISATLTDLLDKGYRLSSKVSVDYLFGSGEQFISLVKDGTNFVFGYVEHLEDTYQSSDDCKDKGAIYSETLVFLSDEKARNWYFKDEKDESALITTFYKVTTTRHRLRNQKHFELAKDFYFGNSEKEHQQALELYKKGKGRVIIREVTRPYYSKKTTTNLQGFKKSTYTKELVHKYDFKPYYSSNKPTRCLVNSNGRRLDFDSWEYEHLKRKSA